MLNAALLAVAVAVGVPLPVVAVAAVAAVDPLPALAAIAVLAAWSVRRRRRSDPSEADLLRRLGAELAAGASPRFALAALAAGHDDAGLRRCGRLALAGAPMDRVATGLVAVLPGSGRLLAAAITLAAATGAGLGGLVRRLAERADVNAELDRERRAATVQARMSTLVVGLAPLAFTGVLVAAGAVPAPWRATGALAALSAAGIVLEAAGFGVVLVLLRRHAR